MSEKLYTSSVTKIEALSNGHTMYSVWYPTSSSRTSVELPEVEDIEIILSPDATIIKNHYNNTKTVVRKCEDDTENRELAVTFGLLKNLGITPAQVQRMMANAKDYRNPVGKKNAKKNTND